MTEPTIVTKHFTKGYLMTTKQSNQYGDTHQPCDDIEYALFCHALEAQYQQAKEEGLFEVLSVLELDTEHSDKHLVQAVDYFNEKEGVVEKGAPMDFLTEYEKSIVNQEGTFRAELYCMLLSIKFSEAIENKSAFIQHSFKYGVYSE